MNYVNNKSKISFTLHVSHETIIYTCFLDEKRDFLSKTSGETI